MSDLQIAAFRKRAGLTQGQLAGRLRISRAYLSAIENGHTVLPEHIQRRIIKALGIAPDEVNVMLGAPPFRRRMSSTQVPSDNPANVAKLGS